MAKIACLAAKSFGVIHHKAIKIKKFKKIINCPRAVLLHVTVITLRTLVCSDGNFYGYRC